MFGKSVTVENAHEAHTGGAIILDVRTEEEWREQHVPGAHHAALASLHQRADLLKRKYGAEKVLVICRSGSRSAGAASFLRRLGIDALNVKGGLIAWNRQGLPVTSGR